MKGAERPAPPEEAERAAKYVLDAAFEVHRELGPGFTEQVYRDCLLQELAIAPAVLEVEATFPIQYKGNPIGRRLRLDLLVDEVLVVELKSVEGLHPVLRKHLLSYLRLTGFPLGLLINFNVPLLRQGIRRVVR